METLSQLRQETAMFKMDISLQRLRIAEHVLLAFVFMGKGPSHICTVKLVASMLATSASRMPSTDEIAGSCMFLAQSPKNVLAVHK
jgi:hypothetical protein